MKRLGNIWGEVLDKGNAFCAVVEGTRFKRNQRAVRRLLNDDHTINYGRAQEFTAPIIEKLNNDKWTHKTPRYRRQFCKNHSNKGKWRDLYIPCLEDHIVAHMVMQVSIKAFTRGMHPYCCGSVPGRGISCVLKNVDRWMKNDLECRYFVKLDIRHFFDNIDRDILYRKLIEKIKDEKVLRVFRQIIDSAPIPCPVGYYTSPWFANLYLETLDWYIEQQLYKERRGKRIKYVRHYIRYMDDMLLIGTSKSDLYKAVRAIQKYLKTNLGLEIKPEWEIKRIGKHDNKSGKWKLKEGTYWCDIAGYKFCKDATTVRDGIFLCARRSAKTTKYTHHWCQSIISRIGWIKQCDSRSFIEDFIKPYVNIKLCRRLIGNVDKITKRQRYDASRKRKTWKQRDPAQKLSPCSC